MNNDWATEEYEETFHTFPYDIGVPVALVERVYGCLYLSYDLDRNLFIHFASPYGMSPVYRLPTWWQFAN